MKTRMTLAAILALMLLAFAVWHPRLDPRPRAQSYLPQ